MHAYVVCNKKLVLLAERKVKVIAVSAARLVGGAYIDAEPHTASKVKRVVKNNRVEFS